jgi:hypothetical protein
VAAVHLPVDVVHEVTGAPMEQLAKVLARRDHAEGGHRHGGWGAALVFWAATVRREHSECGPLDRSGIEAFRKGETDRLVVVCPVHGELVAPAMPTTATAGEVSGV